MKKTIFLAIIICQLSLIQAQQANLPDRQAGLDSLYAIWQDETKPDTVRVQAFSHYINKGFLYSNPDTAYVLAQELLAFHEHHQYPGAKLSSAEIIALNYMAVSHAIRGDLRKALVYFERCLKASEESGDKLSVSSQLGNIGITYKEFGNYPKALVYLQRSLKIMEELGDKGGCSVALNGIGGIYRMQSDFPNALDYFQQALKIEEERGDQLRIAINTNSIGLVYQNHGDKDKALEYYTKALKLYENISDKRVGPGTSAATISNMGRIFSEKGDIPKALEYYNKALKIYGQVGDESSSVDALVGIGRIYFDQGNYPKALEYCKKSERISEEVGLLNAQLGACTCIYDTYKAMGKGNEALVYMEKMRVVEDSLNAGETAKKLQQMEFAKVMLQDSIAKAEEARLVLEAHQEEVRQKNKARNIALGGGAFVLLLAGGLFARNRYITKSKATLQIEKDRSENLLLNILPEEIARELKIYGKAEARDFDLVSILFTDFKEFTQTSEKLTAQQLVGEINTCFEAFDTIIAKYKIEKIKTIGDAYMAAGGLPVPTGDSIKNTVLAALEMQEFITSRKRENELQSKPAFEMRVGIHTGPVIAGIVGVKKFQYDIWGDTVNTASRIESSGDVGKVNVSQTTYELLKDDPQFAFESRGKIEAKGKGEIAMYFVSKA